MTDTRGRIPPEIEEAIQRLRESEDPAQAAFDLAAIANRVAAVLNKHAHDQAELRKGTPEWGRWARLGNAARDAVLRTAAARQAAGDIIGRAKGA